MRPTRLIGLLVLLASGASLADGLSVSRKGQYQCTGTGCVSRSMANKEGDWVSAKDFGADPSASAATNTASIQAALTYVGNLTGGGTVLIPVGTYSVNPTLVIGKSNVWLRGQGQSNTILTSTGASGASAGVISITAGGALSNIGMTDFGIVCTGSVLQPYAGGTGAINNYGLFVGVDTTGMEANNLSFSACSVGVGGIYPPAGSTLLHNSSVTNSTFVGLSPSVLSLHVAIWVIADNSVFDNNIVSGFTIGLNSPPWANQNRWTNNTVLQPANGNDVGIYLSGAFKSIVSHNHIVMTLPISALGDGCIKMGAYNDPHVSDKWLVADNYCENGAIKYSRCSEGTIANNHVNSSLADGIFFDSAVHPVWTIVSITASSPSAGFSTYVVNSSTAQLSAPANITIAGTTSGHDGIHALSGTGTNSMVLVDAVAGNVGAGGTATPFDINGINETVAYCKRMKIIGNTVLNAGSAGATTGTGIKALTADRFVVNDNIIEAPGGVGIDMRSGTDLVVSGNMIANTVNQCIYIDGIVRGSISNNNCQISGTFVGTPGIRLGNTSSFLTLTGNVVNNYYRGIQVDTGTNDHILITGNNLIGCGAGNCTYGIYEDGTCTFCNAGLNATTNYTNVPGNLGGTSSVPGTATLVAGAATAGVPAGCNPGCMDTTAAAAVKCTVSSTNLTIAGTGTDVIKYWCN